MSVHKHMVPMTITNGSLVVYASKHGYLYSHVYVHMHKYLHLGCV